jgi:threonine dehydrogenase-like Zn-dependent dehydrogenase
MAQTSCLTTSGSRPELSINQGVRKQVTIHGPGVWTGDGFRHAVDLVQSVWVDRTPLISHRYFLANAAYAFVTQAQPDAAVEVLREL